MNQNQRENIEKNCCVDYCIERFETKEETITNTYKCKSKKLGNADLWQIQKGKKYFNY
jgi:hypothetical protein